MEDMTKMAELEDREPETEAEADQFIRDIRFSHGDFDENDAAQLQKTSAEYQRKTQKAAESTRKSLAASLNVFSSELYSNKFRFIHEMIQNADDAYYSNATQDPFMRFTIRDSAIIVETNEDGFRSRNVKAICDIGDSSKKEEADSIGEKGLGFKSVFGISSEVQIQSGIWSFKFEHDADDDGLGMITPHWAARDQDLDPTITRFRLAYNAETTESLDKLVVEFEKLPPTTTFFLKNIHTLQMVIDTESCSLRKTFHKEGLLDGQITSIDITTDGVQQNKKFRTVSKDIALMPREKKRQGKQRSHVTLGFPIYNDKDDEDIPLIEATGQHVFAFLPVANYAQLKFLIQADFVTSASRESIIDCPWNQRLLQGVAETFSTAVYRFVRENEALAYMWMRYFPTSHIPGFWEPLPQKVLNHLLKERVLVSRKEEANNDTGNSFISDLRALPPIYLDGDGDPLFKDLSEEDIYLSSRYEDSDIDILQDHLGLDLISYEEMLKRFEVDLVDSDSSFKGADFNELWYIIALDFIAELWSDESIRRKMKILCFIPLNTDSSWVAPPDGTSTTAVHFLKPETDADVPDLPTDINLQILDPKACLLPEHRQAYTSLGVTDWEPDQVLNRILAVYTSKKISQKLSDWTAHLELLYWFGRKLTYVQSKSIQVVDSKMKLRSWTHYYFPTDADFEAKKLLEETEYSRLSSYCGFLHQSYMSSPMTQHYRNGTTWMAWLEKVIQVRYYPPLTDPRTGSNMSQELKLVLEDNPSKFIDNLKEHWESDYKIAYNNPQSASLRSEIRTCTVPLRDGTKSKIQDSFLPTPELLTKVDEFGLKASFPFVQSAVAGSNDHWREWLFLKDLGICCHDNLKFYLEVIVQLKWQSENEETGITQVSAKVLEAYKAVGSLSQLTARSQIQEHFKANNTIFAPVAAGRWRPPSECVWDGPDFMQTKLVLKKHYGNIPALENLFVNDLKIRSFTVDDMLEELVSLQALALDTTDDRAGIALRIYERLHTMTVNQGMDQFEAVKDRFRDDKLVLVDKRWYAPTSCIWNAPVNIPGRPTIQSAYPSLKGFFVDRLDVETVRVELLVDQIIRISKRDVPDIGSIKQNMRALSMMLVMEGDLSGLTASPKWKRLQEARFYPVGSLNGEVQLAGMSDEFFVMDNKRFEDAFQGKVRLLDFSVEDLMTMDTLFRALPITSRYLSNQVRTDTTVEQSTTHESLTQALQTRSYALSCCAIACHSWKYANRDIEIHRLLLDSQVRVSSNLRTSLVVNTREGDVKVQSDRVLGKVERTAKSLTFYVPQEREAQKSCYRSYLPVEIAKLLGPASSGADRKIYRILTEPIFSLNSIMIEEDIPQVEWIEKHPLLLQVPVLDEAAAEAANAATIESPETAPAFGSMSTFAFPLGATSRTMRPRSPGRSSSPLPSLLADSNLAVNSVAYPPFNFEMGKDEYRALLERVIRLARNVNGDGNRQPNNVFDLSDLRHALPSQYNSVSAMFGIQGSARAHPSVTNRIGAAGELFAFETFLAEGLPDFTIDNWQSRIRHFVNLVPQYEQMRAWNAPEIADIMYEDVGGYMRKILEDFSIDGLPNWWGATVTFDGAHRPIKYRLEVKTTEGPCDHPFYMSRNQFKQMRQCAVAANGPPAEVYVIVRVFNLGREDMGIRLFVDPWRLWDTKLRFESDTLAVISSTDIPN